MGVYIPVIDIPGKAVALQSIDENPPAIKNSSGANYYLCRAWAKFDLTGVSAIVNGSGNISSITKLANGDCNITLLNAMPDSNYAVTAFAADYDNTGDPMVVTAYTTDAYSTNVIRIRTKQGAGASQSSPNIGVAIFR